MNYVGLDIGTTNIGISVVDAEKRQVVMSHTITGSGFLHSDMSWEKIQDPEAIVYTARNVLEKVLEEYTDIKAIGLTGQMHGIIYIDSDGNSLSPLYTWQDGRGNITDADGNSFCNELKNRYKCQFYTGYGLVTHLFNIKNGLVPQNAVSFCTIADYLGMKLSERKKPIVHSSNAASFGFYNIYSNSFETEILLNECVNPDFLPETTTSIKIIGYYNGIPVITAIGDNQASFLGTIKNAEDEILINYGTGSQISVFMDKPLSINEIECRPFIDDTYLLVGASLCGGRAYSILAEFFKKCASMFGIDTDNTYEAMSKLLEKDETDELIVDTRFDGTRVQPCLRGSIGNISVDNFTPYALTKGVIAGMASELYRYYLLIKKNCGCCHSEIVASGNAVRKNSALQKKTSEVFGMELVMSDLTEEASCGAALAAYSCVDGAKWGDVVGFNKTKKR